MIMNNCRSQDFVPNAFCVEGHSNTSVTLGNVSPSDRMLWSVPINCNYLTLESMALLPSRVLSRTCHPVWGGHGVWRGSQLLYHGNDFAEFHPIALKELLWDFFGKVLGCFLSVFSCLFRFGFSVICLIVVWFCQILNWSRCYRVLSSFTSGSRREKADCTDWSWTRFLQMM